MKEIIYTGARLIERERKNLSPSGNPRALCVFETAAGDVIRATTATDSSAGYTVENWRYSGIADVETHTTRAGRVIIDYIRNVRKPAEVSEGVRHV